MKLAALPALALFFAATGSSHAQQPLVEIDDVVMIESLGANADTVDDWDVFLADGSKIGDVEDVLGTNATTPTALAIDFEGNGGYADRDVVVPLDRLALSDGRLVLDADAATVQSMPEWDD